MQQDKLGNKNINNDDLQNQSNLVESDLLQFHFDEKYKKFNIKPNESNKDLEKTKRLKFTKEEDDMLKMLVSIYGAKNWAHIASMMNLRTPKQCRDRYANYLAPGFINREWENNEDKIILDNYLNFGPKWSLISVFIPGRSPNSIKNRWKHHLSQIFKLNSLKNLKLSKTLKYSTKKSDKTYFPQLEKNMLASNSQNVHNEKAKNYFFNDNVMNDISNDDNIIVDDCTYDDDISDNFHDEDIFF